MKNAEEYADIIIRDEREKISKETPTRYGDDRIERVYEFDDGATVRYDWQSRRASENSKNESYNHRFVLVTLPSPNPLRLKKGIIKKIDYLWT